MAPRSRRGQAAEPQAFHELGVRGRKTGVFLPDGGERDEHGMQPLDAIFSSPQKAPANDAGDSGSDDMDIASSAGPGPQTLLKNQRGMKLPLPRSRSPLKTNLGSAARKNPLVDRLSSPTRRSAGEDRDVTVTRRLDFASRTDKSAAASARVTANGANGVGAADDDSVLGADAELDMEDMMEESLQMVAAMGGGSDDNGDDGREDDGGGTPEREEQDTREPPVKRRRGRLPRQQRQNGDPDAGRGVKKRRSLGSPAGGDEAEEAQDEDDEEPRQAKRQRTKGPAAAAKTAPARTAAPASASAGKSKAAKPVAERKADDRRSKQPTKGRRGRKAQTAGTGGSAGESAGEEAGESAGEEAGERSMMALQRGPPMPKSRGLVSVRRDADAVTQTRSGRHSYRPVEYWRGEQVICEDEEQDDRLHKTDFVLPTVKQIVRVPRDAPPAKRNHGRAKARPRAAARARQADEGAAAADEEPEPWELDPGTVTGEVVLWEPEHEEHPPADDEPVQVMDDRIAMSADAMQTSDIKDATFRFAKTLTLPFMGAGVVDLPPGSEKRPKNSRKMHMVFFVHYGKVLVTINEVQFRISAGGMWFVPRGNYYSIANDYDGPCRIFFSQACEVPARRPDASQPPADAA